jgi:hypothetical protein
MIEQRKARRDTGSVAPMQRASKPARVIIGYLDVAFTLDQ